MLVRTFANYLFERAKNRWWGALACKFAVFLVSVLLAFSPNEQWKWLPWVALALSVTGDLLLLWSDRLRSDAEVLLRKLDLEASLSWPIDRRELADLEVRYKSAQAKPPEADPYFASTSVGLKRALENLRESAWWSKHLSETMFASCLFILAISLLVTLVSLVTALNLLPAPEDTQTAVAVAKTAIGLLMLMLSLGVLKMTLGYHSFARKCQAIEDRASSALAGEAPSEAAVVKAWADYHIARAGAPLLPTLVWKLRRDHLNAVWNRQFPSA